MHLRYVLSASIYLSEHYLTLFGTYFLTKCALIVNYLLRGFCQY